MPGNRQAGVGGERDPHACPVESFTQAVETLRRHANHLERSPSDPDCLSDDRWRGLKSTLPQRIAENDDLSAIPDVLVLDRASDGWKNTQCGEIHSVDGFASEEICGRCGLHRRKKRCRRCDTRERLLRRAEILEVRSR